MIRFPSNKESAQGINRPEKTFEIILKKVLTNKKKCEMLELTPSGIYGQPQTPKPQGRQPLPRHEVAKRKKKGGKTFVVAA